jgi:hypothetical protein
LFLAGRFTEARAAYRRMQQAGGARLRQHRLDQPNFRVRAFLSARDEEQLTGL